MPCYFNIFKNNNDIEIDIIIRNRRTAFFMNGLVQSKKESKDIIEIRESRLLSEVKEGFFKKIDFPYLFYQSGNYHMNMSGQFFSPGDLLCCHSHSWNKYSIKKALYKKRKHYGLAKRYTEWKIVPEVLSNFVNINIFKIRTHDGKFYYDFLKAMNSVSNGGSSIFGGVYIENQNELLKMAKALSKIAFFTYKLSTKQEEDLSSVLRFSLLCCLSSVITRLIYVAYRVERNEKFIMKRVKGKNSLYCEDFVYPVSFNNYYLPTGEVENISNPVYIINKSVLRVPASFFIPTYKSVLCRLFTAIETLEREDDWMPSF